MFNQPLATFIYCISLLTLSTTGYASSAIGAPDPKQINYPNHTPPSAKMVLLGKTLFFDNRLTEGAVQSCASCHIPQLGWSDGMAKGVDHKGKEQKLNSPGLCNAAWIPEGRLHWVGRTKSLEQQAFKSAKKRKADSYMFPKIKNIPYYREAFATLFPETGMTLKTFAVAVAAFERSIVCDDSPFDHYINGDTFAMSPAAIRGMGIFQEKGNCTLCHTGANFTDYRFHNIGIELHEGRKRVTHEDTDKGKFKTPGLRNVALSAPYMHDGSLASLEEVVAFYNRGGRAAGKLTGVDPLIMPLNLSKTEQIDLITFLTMLTDSTIMARPQIP